MVHSKKLNEIAKSDLIGVGISTPPCDMMKYD